MRQDDVINPASKEYVTAVTGGSGKYFAPKGVTMNVGTSQITDGIPAFSVSSLMADGDKRRWMDYYNNPSLRN